MPPTAPLVDIPLPWPVAMLFAGLLLLLAWHDMRERRLPNVFTYPLLATGLVWTGYAAPALLIAHALAAAVALVTLYGVGLIYHHRRGHAGLGFGDVKLLAAIGAWLGPYALAPTLLLAALSALAWAPWHARRTGEPLNRIRIPFGTFLTLAALAVTLSQV